jgi:hypothetical protein
MDPLTINILVDDIVDAVYPQRSSLRERYFLSQSIYLLIAIARSKRNRSVDEPREKMRLLIKNAMLGGRRTDEASNGFAG